MNSTQFAHVVTALGIASGDRLLIWLDGQADLAIAKVTRVAKDSTWFNADLQASASGGMAWANGKRITAENVYNISRSAHL